MNIKNVLFLSLVTFLSSTTLSAEQVSPLNLDIQRPSPNGLEIEEAGQHWSLESQSEVETLDLRIYGTNTNPFRAQKLSGNFVTLSTHILVVGDRGLSNESYRESNCEAKAAQLNRTIFVLTENTEAFNLLEAMREDRAKIPGEEGSRLCALLHGSHYGVTHFSRDGTRLDNQLTEVKMIQGPAGLDPKNIFVISRVEVLPCER